MQVLVALARAEGAVVSRGDLIELCWGGVIVGEDAINRVASRVRRLAGLSDPPPFHVDTIPKIGYRLVRTGEGEESAPATQGRIAPAPARPGRFLIPPVALAAALFAAAMLALIGLRFRPDDKTITVAAPQRIAVMPLDVEGGAEDQDYLAAGISEEIHGRLARFDGLEVVGLSSAAALHGVTSDLEEIGRRLGARYILQGGLRQDGDILNLRFELIDARKGSQVWVDGFWGELKDVSRIEEEVERVIAQTLHVAIPASPLGPNLSAENPDAYELYLRGAAAFRRFETGGDEGALALLSRAVERDPELNAARALLALSYAMHANNTVRAAGDFEAHARTRERASETALAALAIEPENPVALTALGAVRMQEKLYDEAETLFDFVRALSPEEEAASIVLSLQLAHAGHVKKARSRLAEVMDIHPASRLVSYLAGYELQLGDYESALEHAKLPYSLKNPAGRWPYLLALAALGRADEAAEINAAELAALPPGEARERRMAFWNMTFGAFRDEAGRARYIASIREKLDQRDPELEYLGAEQILTLLGETELRDRLLLHLIETGAFDRNPLGLTGIWTPSASGVRAAPQFRELVIRMNFLPYWKARGWPDGCWPKGEDDFECG